MFCSRASTKRLGAVSLEHRKPFISFMFVPKCENICVGLNLHCDYVTFCYSVGTPSVASLPFSPAFIKVAVRVPLFELYSGGC